MTAAFNGKTAAGTLEVIAGEMGGGAGLEATRTALSAAADDSARVEAMRKLASALTPAQREAMYRAVVSARTK